MTASPYCTKLTGRILSLDVVRIFHRTTYHVAKVNLTLTSCKRPLPATLGQNARVALAMSGVDGGSTKSSRHVIRKHSAQDPGVKAFISPNGVPYIHPDSGTTARVDVPPGLV